MFFFFSRVAVNIQLYTVTPMFNTIILFQSSRFTSPRSTLRKPYVCCTTLQFYYVFYTTFSLSPLSLLLERCTKYMQYVQRYTISCVYCNVVRNTFSICNIVYFQSVSCNVLRWGRMGTIKRLYKIHSKIVTLYKIYRFFCNVYLGEVNLLDWI